MITIPSPNVDRSLLTIAELRSAVGATDDSQDASLQILGDAISAIITSACGIVVAGAIPPTLRLESIVETVRPRHRLESFSLSRGPVVEITSLTEDGAELSASDYELDGRTVYRIVASHRHFWSFRPHFAASAIVVHYDAGYDTVPADLKFAALKMVKEQISIGDRDPTLKSLRIEGVSERQWWVNPPTDSLIPADIYDLLERGGYINKFAWMI